MKNTIAQNIWKPDYLKIFFDTCKVLATSFYRLPRVYFQYLVTLVMIDMYICMWSPAGNMLIQLNRRLAA